MLILAASGDGREPSPAEFIPIIEAPPHVHALTNWVLDAGMIVLASQGARLSLSVKIRTATLKRANFAGLVVKKLLARNIHSGLLELEVAETLMMSHCITSIGDLAELIDAVIAIAIDDFGTGHSNLSYLPKMPVTAVKVVRSLDSEMRRNKKDAAVVDALIGLGRKLDYRLVAEGIEDCDTASMLQALGFHEGQAYWFSRPLEIVDLIDWLAGGS